MKKLIQTKNNRSDVFDIVKHAISNADRGLFFMADHSKQAFDVIKNLDLMGYNIVPKEPSPDMIKAGRLAISYGITDPSELIAEIYKKMIDEYVI